MFNKKSLRLALSGSILVILIGSMSGCSEDPSAPKVATQHDTVLGNCTLVNGQVVCSN